MSKAVESTTSIKPQSTENPPSRDILSSIRAILKARHANTGRHAHAKRTPQGVWMREMIVVKQYSQMDALREVLDLPARKYSNMVSVEEYAELEVQDSCRDEDEIPNQVARNLKRKRDQEVVEAENDCEAVEPDAKRLRISEDYPPDPKVPTTPDPDGNGLLTSHPGKENVPPEV